MAMCEAAKEAVWLTGLLGDLGMDLWSPLIVGKWLPRPQHVALTKLMGIYERETSKVKDQTQRREVLGNGLRLTG